MRLPRTAEGFRAGKPLKKRLPSLSPRITRFMSAESGTEPIVPMAIPKGSIRINGTSTRSTSGSGKSRCDLESTMTCLKIPFNAIVHFSRSPCHTYICIFDRVLCCPPSCGSSYLEVVMFKRYSDLLSGVLDDSDFDADSHLKGFTSFPYFPESFVPSSLYSFPNVANEL